MIVSLKVPIVRPQLGEGEESAVLRVVRSGWLTQGVEVAEFERELAAAVGAPHAVAVSNCTVGLELALRCAGVRPGDEVVTVSHSFVATANAIIAVGAVPVFVDVEPDTFGMDPLALVQAIGPRTRAVLCVHQIGIPCDVEAIVDIAGRAGVPVIEDAACAIGSEVLYRGRWERIGRPHGLLACFSFHPRKVITTGDGGMITTADATLAARLRLLRQHAMSIPDTVRHESDRVVFEQYVEPAFNHRLTDLQAAIGRPQLARLGDIIAERRALAETYRSQLEDHPMLAPAVERATARGNWQSYPVTLRSNARLSQIEVMQFLLDRGIASKRGVTNAHQEPAYAGQGNWRCAGDGCDPRQVACRHLAVSERLRDSTVLLPLFHGMRPDEREQVLAACRELG